MTTARSERVGDVSRFSRRLAADALACAPAARGVAALFRDGVRLA